MKNILIALDLSDIDETLIRYAYFLQKKFQLETVHFVHNIKVYDINEALHDMLVGKDIQAIIRKSLTQKIEKCFDREHSYKLEVLEHDSTEYNLNTWAIKNDIDTIIMGFKTEQLGTGAMLQKLIRIFKGNVLLVPKTASFKWERLLLPTDLSANFQKVAAKTNQIIEYSKDLEVRILKAFTIPSLFFPLIDDKKAIIQSQKHIDKQFDDIKNRYSLNPKWVFESQYQDEKSIVDIIKKEQEKWGADLIIMAAKGSSKVSSIFIGSTINELINSGPFQSIYIIKDKH